MATTVPSVSSNTGTLTAPGVGSGLDVKSIVSQLMAVEQKPLTLLDTQEANFQAKLTSLGAVKGAFSSLQTAAQALSAASVVSYKATASDSTVFTATADATASIGSYSVEVSHLAQAQKLVTSAANGKTSTTAAIGSGAATTLTFAFGTISGTFNSVSKSYDPGASFDPNTNKTGASVTIDSGNNTLTGIRDAINASGAGVTASIINDGGATPYRLALTPDDTGAANSIKLSVTGDATLVSLLANDPAATQNMTQTMAAQDASLSIDGIAISSATNAVSGAIPGVTLNLAKESTAATKLSVQRDTSALSSALDGLVKAYNSTNTAIATATAKGAVMQGDWGVLRLQQQARAILSGAQSTGGAFTMLSHLGITFQRDGTLVASSTKVNAALSSNPTDAAAFASALGTALNSAATSLLGSTGVIANQTNGINSSIKDIGNRRTVLQARITNIQNRYQTQFTALDVMISNMNKTSAYLTEQLAKLPGVVSSTTTG
jgi:flagellar hook-associated protein 2